MSKRVAVEPGAIRPATSDRIKREHRAKLASNKREERRRKRENGYRPLEVWVSAEPGVAEELRDFEKSLRLRHPPKPGAPK